LLLYLLTLLNRTRGKLRKAIAVSETTQRADGEYAQTYGSPSAFGYVKRQADTFVGVAEISDRETVQLE
jgi:hypothetical protein